MAADTDPQLTAVGRELERTGRRVRDLELLVRQLATDVEALAATEDTGSDAEPTGARAWLLLTDPDQAHDVLTDLGEWLGAVYLNYPDTTLPSCWLWHPGVVEELWALRQAHHEVYSAREGSPAKAVDWHDRQRPGVARRVNAALRDCELALHEQPHQPPVTPLLGSAERITQAWTQARTTPHPTSEELSAADQHDHQHHRDRHHS